MYQIKYIIALFGREPTEIKYNIPSLKNRSKRCCSVLLGIQRNVMRFEDSVGLSGLRVS